MGDSQKMSATEFTRMAQVLDRPEHVTGLEEGELVVDAIQVLSSTFMRIRGQLEGFRCADAWRKPNTTLRLEVPISNDAISDMDTSSRVYTVAEIGDDYDITIDAVRHDADSPMMRWLASAQPGDRMVVKGPTSNSSTWGKELYVCRCFGAARSTKHHEESANVNPANRGDHRPDGRRPNLFSGLSWIGGYGVSGNNKGCSRRLPGVKYYFDYDCVGGGGTRSDAHAAKLLQGRMWSYPVGVANLWILETGNFSYLIGHCPASSSEAANRFGT